MYSGPYHTPIYVQNSSEPEGFHASSRWTDPALESTDVNRQPLSRQVPGSTYCFWQAVRRLERQKHRFERYSANHSEKVSQSCLFKSSENGVFDPNRYTCKSLRAAGLS